MCDRQQIEQAVKEYQAEINCEGNFRFIYECYYPQVFNFIRFKLFGRKEITPDPSEDLTQEVLVRVFIHLEEFRYESEFYTWVVTVAKNVIADEVRKQMAGKRHGHHIWIDSPAGDNEKPFDLPDPSLRAKPLEMARNEEHKRILSEAAASLSPRRRSCWILRNEQDRSVEEIATIMKISEGAVKAHLDQAKTKMREFIVANYGESDIYRKESITSIFMEFVEAQKRRCRKS
jgi:RNA polymerase sigma factor (sigma-70 family)